MKQKEIFEIIEKSNFQKNFCIYDQVDNVNYYLNKTDILVNCSYSSEGFPNILGEGIINNCLCITSGIGDAKRIFNNNNFFIFKNEKKILEEKILSILDMKNKELDKIKQDLRKNFINNYSISKLIDKYNELY